MGIEHQQTTILERYAFEILPPGDSEEVLACFPANDQFPDGGSLSPNQKCLARAVQLAAARETEDPEHISAARRAVSAFLASQDTYGHQATSSGGYGCEQLCCDVHGGIWWTGIGSMLRDAEALGLTALVESLMDWIAVHLALCRAFWTPQGVRAPCSRAVPAKDGRPLRPSWAIDSLLYSLITGETPGPAIYFGSRNELPIRIMRQSVALWPAIAERSKTEVPKLMIPLLRWDRSAHPGGFIAAMAIDTPMNQRMSWISVDGLGVIQDCGISRAYLPAETNGVAPTTVIGVFERSLVLAPAPTGAPVEKPLPPVQDASGVAVQPDPDDDPAQRSIAAQLAGLTLAKVDSLKRRDLSFGLLGRQLSAAELNAAAASVAAYGINPDSPQAQIRAKIVAALQNLAADGRK